MSSETPLEQDIFQCPRGNECPISGEIMALHATIEKLQKQAHTDALTGLYNKRHFQSTLIQELERTQRTHQPTTLLLIDIDHFKHINDTYGHVAGDAALVHISGILQRSLRKLDIPCRYGGEEFTVILPSTPLIVASQAAERLRHTIDISEFSWQGSVIPITASFGLDTSWTGKEFSPEEFVAQADHWLYEAKHSGRNCVRHGSKKQVSDQMVSTTEKEALNRLLDGEP